METMVSSSRRTENNLKDRLYNRTYEFDFHQAIRLMQYFEPNSAPLGEGVDPSKEALRLTSKIDFSFSKSDLETLLPIDTRYPLYQQPRLVLNFMGLAGVSKPLPTPYAYRIYQRLRHKDTASADFLDIFNHRFGSLLYRIHKKYRVSLSDKPLEKSVFGRALSSLAGLYQGIPNLRNRLSVHDRSILGYSSYFWNKTNSAYGLHKILSSYFKIPVQVHQFQGNWACAQEDQWTRLSANPTTARYNQLGTTTVLGTKCWDQHAGITIQLGPLAYDKFLQFLPTQTRFNSLKDLARLYLNNLITININYHVEGKTIPSIKLGQGSLLGYNTWVHALPLSTDMDQVKVSCP